MGRKRKSASVARQKKIEGARGTRKGERKGQSLVNRPSKHPQGSMANHILTQRAVAKTSTAEVPRINEEAYTLAFPVRGRQCVTANKRMAAIGGANAYSPRDRLSFVTSFTVSNDTHCFWTPSYARPGHLALTRFIISFFSASLFLFIPLSPEPSLSHPRQVTRASLRHRLLLHSAIIALAPFSTDACATVGFDLLGLRDLDDDRAAGS